MRVRCVLLALAALAASADAFVGVRRPHPHPHPPRRLAMSTVSGPEGVSVTSCGCRADVERSLQSAVEEDKLVVIRYYAKWCRSCRMVGRHFKNLAGNMREPVAFVDVDIGNIDTAKFAHEQGVKAVPTVQVWGPVPGEESLTPLDTFACTPQRNPHRLIADRLGAVLGRPPREA